MLYDTADSARSAFADAPVCKPGLPAHYAASALQRVVIACEVSAQPSDVHFEWVANTSVRAGRIGSFVTNGTRSLASTVTGTELEYGILLCFASNNVGKQIEPCSFRIVPPGELYFSLFLPHRYTSKLTHMSYIS